MLKIGLRLNFYQFTLLCILFAFIPYQLKSQVADSLDLKVIIISAETNTGIPALKSIELDSTVLSLAQTRSLGNVLQNFSAISIKTYGSPGIQTPTFRGMGASHTKIYLNGLDISPSSLGQSDLSILPGFLFDEVGVKYGNAAFTEGVGAIGGGVMLKSNAKSTPLGTSLVLGGSVGSFGNQALQFKYGYKTHKWESVTKYVFQNGANDFNYRNIAQPNSPDISQTNSRLNSHGVRQTLKHYLNAKNTISFNGILSFVDREIPGLMTDVTPSQQEQKDEALILQMGWKHYGTRSQSDLIIGYNYSLLKYEDPQAQINSTTINKKFQIREDYDYEISKHWALNATANLSWATAENVNYSGSNNQMISSVLVGLNGHLSSRWEVGAFVQPTWSQTGTESGNIDVLPMVSVAFLPKKNKTFVIGLNAAQNVHYPTLNDLFWVPGGNPDLKSEKASNVEVNVHLENDKPGTWDWSIDGSGYYGNVENWILWQPTDKGYWSAQNLKSVEHYGGEIKAGIKKNISKVKLSFTTSYQYVRSMNKDVNDASLDKQLIYTPEHSANWLLSGRYKTWGAFVNYNFVGRRYITTSNSSYLPEYDLVDVTFTYQLRKDKWQNLDFQLDINNILNKEYMSVAWRPMPGVNGQFTMRYILN